MRFIKYMSWLSSTIFSTSSSSPPKNYRIEKIMNNLLTQNQDVLIKPGVYTAPNRSLTYDLYFGEFYCSKSNSLNFGPKNPRLLWHQLLYQGILQGIAQRYFWQLPGVRQKPCATMSTSDTKLPTSEFWDEHPDFEGRFLEGW